MRFTADRKQMSIICKNLARLVPESSPIEDLTGILIVADENSGSLRIVATNLEITVEYHIGAVVAEGGRMVLKGSLIAGMMPLFREDKISFSTLTGANVVKIEGGNANYCISFLSGKHFPEPHGVPPDGLVKLSGLAGLAKQTSFAAKKKPGSPSDMLVNAKLDIYPAESHMTCTNSETLAIARQRQQNGGRVSLLIPIKSLPLLTAICGDEPVEAGMSGTMLVFRGKDFVFTTRTVQGIYPDTNTLLSQIKPIYDAIVDAGAFKSGIQCAGTVFEPGMYVRLALRESGIELFYESSLGKFSTTTDAVVLNDMPGEGFYYSAGDLDNALRNMEGNLQIGIDRTGIMLLKSDTQCYLLTPRRPRKMAAPKKEKKSKTKKADKANIADKAA